MEHSPPRVSHHSAIDLSTRLSPEASITIYTNELLKTRGDPRRGETPSLKVIGHACRCGANIKSCLLDHIVYDSAVGI